MHLLDWAVIALCIGTSLGLGLWWSNRGSKSVETYFASDRGISWWLAGTSMAATAFSSDTPLLVTGIVRERGVWGNWEVWALGISTMLAVFLFSRLWKRAGVMTEVELCERRYDGKPAAFLRGFKALFWGVLYNAYVMGAWPVTGLSKVLMVTTDWSKGSAILFCMGITALYSSLSGYWGVLVTDFFQYIIALTGAILLAIVAVQAAGGLSNIVDQLSHTDKLSIFPPLHASPNASISHPLEWFLGLLLIQWWAWKNADGGGVIVQRIASCKNEKHAVYATLWFNVAQYALRAWPWILTALASLILFPNLEDPETAYPHLINSLLPIGLKGFLVASFLAAFMSTMSTQLNWGASYFIHDFYRRFVNKNAPEKHYVRAGQIVSILLAGAAAYVAFHTSSIGHVFTWILHLTAAIGPVYLLRWFWKRVNPWTEISAMVISLPLLYFRAKVFVWVAFPESTLWGLLFMVVGSALVWIPVTLATPSASEKTLQEFFGKVRLTKEELKSFFRQWVIATLALFSLTAGPLVAMLSDLWMGLLLLIISGFLWLLVAHDFKRTSELKD